MNLQKKFPLPPNHISDTDSLNEDIKIFSSLIGDASNLQNRKMIEQLNGYFEMRQLYNSAIKEINTKLEILNDEFRFRYDRNPIHHIESRLKSPESIFQKAIKRNIDINLKSIEENITDVAGVRVICCYIDDIYMIRDMLLNQNDISLVSSKDYIKAPKPSGYRSLHIVVKIPIFLSDRVENVPVEIQIRTIAMDLWASLDHQLRYKSADKISEGIAEELHVCAEEISKIDEKMQDIYHRI